MDIRNRHPRSTPGINFLGFFSPAVAYATAADIEAFSRTGTEGQIGVFLENNTLRTTLLTAGLKFYFAQISDGEVRRSPLLTFGTDSLSTNKQAYDAPATQVDIIGYNGTSGSLGINLVGGTQEFAFAARETTPANQPFPVEEARYVARVNTLDDYDVVVGLVKDFNNDFDYERNSDQGFAYAQIITDAADTTTGETATVRKGSTGVVASGIHGLSVGDFVLIDVDVLAKVVTVPSTTTFTIDHAWQAASASGLQLDSATVVNNTTVYGIRITAEAETIHFSTAVLEELSGVTITNSVAWKQGSGSGWEVTWLEKHAQVYNGETTQNAPFKEDWGQPATFSTLTGQYDIWNFDYKKVTPSMGFANEQINHLGHVIVSAPTGGGTSPNDELDTIFGT